MKKIIVDTFKASCFKIDPDRLSNSFEILGYDFMMDADFKLNLIEVNTNPCLETDSPLMTRIISELIESTMKLVIDPLFPNPEATSKKASNVNELPTEIKYTLVFDEAIDGINKPPQNSSDQNIESDKEGELDDDSDSEN